MKRIWYASNLGSVPLALWGGYASLAPEKLRHTNPDAIACASILVLMPVFALFSVYYSLRRWKGNHLLSRPSWDRNPLNWWGDPLQSLFISTCVVAATAVGSALRRPTFGSAGFWTLSVYVCFLIGLLVGQVLVYRVYRGQIATA